ncbi:beta-ketoacyl synthase N-terminal-like domain-containing protein [Bacillus sp. NPDC093026]|uniref:beta-ketoacyl synthase N-terminal-like domain-containing protein n=1 Tax=Bacillus sp. NPDC093026 TaxID=3363948 RepID=UPI0037FA5E9E
MYQDKQRIVVTGLGTVSAFGVDNKALWAAIQNSTTSSTSTSSGYIENPRVVQINYLEATKFLGNKGLKFMQPASLYLSVAAIIALENSQIDIKTTISDRLGIVVSTNYSGLKMSCQFDRTSINEGPNFVSPMQAPNTVANSPASHLAIRLQSKAFNTTIASGWCAGLDALGYAVNMLKKNNADTVVVGGTEEWNEEIEWFYKAAGLLSDEDAEEKGKGVHYDSKGVVPGEGSAAVVLERYENAVKRGATILGEIVSWHSSFTSTDSREDKIKGCIRCMDATLKKGAEYNENIDLIISGANGLRKLDSIEISALNEMFPKKPIIRIKDTIGETSGAAGIFQLVSSINAIQSKKDQNYLLKDIKKVLITANDLSGSTSSALVKELT